MGARSSPHPPCIHGTRDRTTFLCRKHVVNRLEQFDFLKSLVENVSDQCDEVDPKSEPSPKRTRSRLEVSDEEG